MSSSEINLTFCFKEIQQNTLHILHMNIWNQFPNVWDWIEKRWQGDSICCHACIITFTESNSLWWMLSVVIVYLLKEKSVFYCPVTVNSQWHCTAMWVGEGILYVCVWLKVCWKCLTWFCHFSLRAIKQTTAPQTVSTLCLVGWVPYVSHTHKCYKGQRMSQKFWSKSQFMSLFQNQLKLVSFRDTQCSPLHQHLCSLSPW